MAATFGAIAGRGSSLRAETKPSARAFMLAALASVGGVPLALSAFLPVSAALPAGAALAGAGALFATAAVFARDARQNEKKAVSERAVDEVSPYNFFAGLVTIHDGRGFVTAVHGRDMKEILSWMRDPMGRGFLDQIHVSDRLSFIQTIDRIRQGAPHATIDIRMERPRLRPDAEQFVHMRVNLTAVRNDDGSLTGVVAQSQDISAEAQLKSEAARKTEEAETANDAKTRFLAAVSHELRTPLNAILGFSDILSGEYFGKLENDRQREYVALINQSGSHLLSVVNTMLDVSKIEAGRYELLSEPFVVSDIVRACEQMLGLQAREKGVKLTSRVQRDLGEAVADQRALQQVLINLVGNAIKFTDAGGLITIDAERRDKDLVLTVSDTGIGIPAAKLDAIGQPFMQVHNQYTRKYEGTGLGLSLVKGLVALHGGSFAIRSNPGEGTVITVRVPADGSGIALAVEPHADLAETVEFPPRLPARDAGAAAPAVLTLPLSGKHNEDGGHDRTRAKTA
ncbi:HAMP domain-containing histidine kinase [Sinorhizobium sp. BG8]|nr:HAMP domain-containing histidine kinase [Sinorhizobium sp. BG8]